VRLDSAREFAENVMREHVVRPSQRSSCEWSSCPFPPAPAGRGEQTRGTRGIQRCPNHHSRGFGRSEGVVPTGFEPVSPP
jgi:hypothetical protein